MCILLKKLRMSLFWWNTKWMSTLPTQKERIQHTLTEDVSSINLFHHKLNGIKLKPPQIPLPRDSHCWPFLVTESQCRQCVLEMTYASHCPSSFKEVSKPLHYYTKPATVSFRENALTFWKQYFINCRLLNNFLWYPLSVLLSVMSGDEEICFSDSN